MKNNKRMFWGTIFIVANIGFIVFIIVSKFAGSPNAIKLTAFENAYKAKATKVKEFKKSYKTEEIYRSYGYVIHVDKTTSKYSLDFVGSIQFEGVTIFLYLCTLLHYFTVFKKQKFL